MEFASADPHALADRFQALLEEYTLSDETGMAVYTGFDPSPLRPFGERVKRGEIDPGELERLRDPRLDLRMAGRGAVGAVAAIPFYTNYEEALALWDGPS